MNETWWWLSFVDGDRTPGDKFIGACIVRGRDIVTALVDAHENGCNPGGGVSGIPFPPFVTRESGFDTFRWTYRILTRDEATEFDEYMYKTYDTPKRRTDTP